MPRLGLRRRMNGTQGFADETDGVLDDLGRGAGGEAKTKMANVEGDRTEVAAEDKIVEESADARGREVRRLRRAREQLRLGGREGDRDGQLDPSRERAVDA